ncbi:MAG: signal peptide peptidase SppA [Verrucomicrobiae bacterium]|nr:signal peptide peptidase SppA [Verrucomicrobiae bacterium]
MREGSRSAWAVIAVILFVLLGFSALLNFLFLASRGKKHETPETIFTEQSFAGDTSATDKIAVVDVKGLITKMSEGATGRDGMVGDIKQELKLATEDKDVKAIIVRIDSPGGEVLASDEIYNAVLKAKEKKKLLVSMGSVAASGGYYIAVGSDYIMADELTITGSIGVIMQTLNYRGLMDKVGLQTYTFKSGKFKDLLNGAREPSPEEMQLVQSLVMETYDKFVGIVAKRRKMDVEALKTGLADGRILSGTQAKAAGFVDELGDFDTAVERAKAQAGITKAKVVQYVVPFSLGRLFGLGSKAGVPLFNKSVQLDLNVGPQQLPLEQGKMYFLASPLM